VAASSMRRGRNIVRPCRPIPARTISSVMHDETATAVAAAARLRNSMLDERDLERFVEQGFVRIDGAFSRKTAAQGRDPLASYWVRSG
jgi:hypothetical protein